MTIHRNEKECVVWWTKQFCAYSSPRYDCFSSSLKRPIFLTKLQPITGIQSLCSHNCYRHVCLTSVPPNGMLKADLIMLRPFFHQFTNKREHKSHVAPFYCQKAIIFQIWPPHNRTKQCTTNSWPMNWHLLGIFDGVLVRRMIAFHFFAALMCIILFFDATIMIISLQNKHCQWR
jgi:hypothetical protein